MSLFSKPLPFPTLAEGFIIFFKEIAAFYPSLYSGDGYLAKVTAAACPYHAASQPPLLSTGTALSKASPGEEWE